MKKISIYSMLFIMIMGSCSEVMIYDPTDEEKAKYGLVYMPRAERGLNTIPLSNKPEEKTLEYSAYYGGPVDATKDIKVSFSVDASKVAEYNEKNGTNYKLFPESGFSLQTTEAAIKARERSTPTLYGKVTSGDHLDLFENYLLPITMKADADVNEEFTTVYFLFPVSYPAGEVPRELVANLGANWGKFITNAAGGSLLRHDHANDIWIHKPDGEGKFNSTPERIGVDWRDSESFYLVNDQSMVVRNHPYWAGLFRFSVNPVNHALDPYGAWETFWLGDFWDQYVMIPFGEYMLTVQSDGVLRRQNMYTHPNASKIEMGSGFNGFKQILSYKNNALLALDNSGSLYLYPVTSEMTLDARRLVGTGWDLYRQIMVVGDDILGLDLQGQIYRYEFNPNGFYPLK